jgi:hypothetical protein
VKALLRTAARKRRQAYARTVGREVPAWCSASTTVDPGGVSAQRVADAMSDVDARDVRILATWLRTDQSGKRGRRPGEPVSNRKRAAAGDDRPSRIACANRLGVPRSRVDGALARAVPALRSAIARGVLP